MPTARASRIVDAPAGELWELLRDPHHLPRWWPRVSGVEGVQEDAFTHLIRTRKGKLMRSDHDIVQADEAAGTIVWEQRLEGTPFAGVLRSSRTTLTLTPIEQDPSRTEVTIELRQRLAGGWDPWAEDPSRLRPRPMSSHMIHRAAARTISEALDGLERIHG